MGQESFPSTQYDSYTGKMLDQEVVAPKHCL